MLANDLKEGMPIKLTQGRVGVMKDNKRGIVRVVEVKVPGQGTDVGSCYIDEIVYVQIKGKWQEVEILESHRKQLKKVRWF